MVISGKMNLLWLDSTEIRASGIACGIQVKSRKKVQVMLSLLFRRAVDWELFADPQGLIGSNRLWSTLYSKRSSSKKTPITRFSGSWK